MVLPQVGEDGSLHLGLGESVIGVMGSLERDVFLAAALDGEADPVPLLPPQIGGDILHDDRAPLIHNRCLLPGALGERHGARCSRLAPVRHRVANSDLISFKVTSFTWRWGKLRNRLFARFLFGILLASEERAWANCPVRFPGSFLKFQIGGRHYEREKF